MHLGSPYFVHPGQYVTSLTVVVAQRKLSSDRVVVVVVVDSVGVGVQLSFRHHHFDACSVRLCTT